MQINTVTLGDSIEEIKNVPDNSIHLILSDIPYGICAEDWDVLHDNKNSALLGSSPSQKKAGKVFSKRGKPINGWSEADRKIPLEYQEWCSKWASEWLRVLKPGGSAIVFSGRRFAHRCTVALEDAGFNFKDMLSWVKPNAYHRAQRVSVVFDRRGDEENSSKWQGWRLGNLRPIFEPILWFTKPYKHTIVDNLLENELGAYNQSFLESCSYCNYTPSNVLSSQITREGAFHPTQKPLELMKTLIELTTLEGHTVLDPFCGSGTTLLAAKELGRNFLGIEINEPYVDISKERLKRLG